MPLAHFRPLLWSALVTTALLAISSGCTTQILVEAPAHPMSISEARQTLKESLNDLLFYTAVQDVKFTRQRVTYSAGNDFEDGKRVNRSLTFAELDKLTIDYVTSKRTLVWANGKWLDFFRTAPGAQRFVDSVLVLKSAAIGPDPEPADFAAFSAQARLWREATPRPELTDEARTYKAVAEDAIKLKDFRSALIAYGDALERFPLWPEGQYNAATLAAEQEDYEAAAYHMHRYLALVPDAPDAAKSKDKFLLWQHKAAMVPSPPHASSPSR